MRDKNPNDSQTIIGLGVAVEGDFNGNGDVIIEGKLKGSIKTTNHLQIGKEAKIEAEINADTAVIAGQVKGNVKVNGALELMKSARLEGNISCQSLTIESGCFFQGNCVMSAKKEQPAQ
jgi:cytoskeletal protein CcmA (bactofilin family)